MGITVEHLSKRFGAFAALDAIDLDIRPGELLALLGPSGSGKTTLLRVIAGLEHADEGRVLFDGQDASVLPVQQRQVGVVFQHYALFKHMRVEENIAFGLKVRRGRARWPKARIAERVRELLSLVQLEGLGARYPTQLSGGQRQRVALARALAIEPKMLLLDEPFGALDAKVRRDLRRWLRQVHEATGVTTVFVTHDQEEALELADRVAILNKGRIEQIGTPAQVYDQPASAFVYGFVGEANRLSGHKAGEVLRVGGLELAAPQGDALADGAVALFVRPQDLQPVAPGQGGWQAQVESVQRSGPRQRIHARLDDGTPLELELPAATESVQVGERVGLVPARWGAFAER
ncbi:sulfate/molybdate ABC transporter ATP-binding protein [Pseudoxanthomonas winnipegensis]|uniref:Sulfate/molybdate ABC transporter ATP-binding protein n=1 Tax=Pseudoxanthomonas winnipegensis TaxID=2480810 RepID=A0A4Q8LRF8_9GAMM|nr:sulfate/molybdate ABC transporter ATP-binding protein [Pseudoxanthomonas winnipegensis]RZZ89049.1 sulfate/molybdate ABC transporter ATP-binding protein [Pseudoxanthomonas winnipegensis]TAA33501.1 sulfate/molybdate ABC transporter ATP-binding protein [Pseudoxanthomonas winnipegensis]TAA43910.1 sulfate/molybdate ABC transporter ATP-binding protein [Pseudoxanthomonas winnipegensis]TBV76073.1 sulfate/molybdate ABC transporter ATP-binding protein [Pseudoxanthomonas winnipegensis]